MDNEFRSYKLLMFTLVCMNAGPICATENRAYVQLNAGAVFAQPLRTSNINCFQFTGCFSFFHKETSDPGYAAGAAIGYRLADQFRLEVEGIYQSNDLNSSQSTFTITPGITSNLPNRTFKFSNNLKGERERTAFLFNGYYDFYNSTPFTPYLSAGLGGYHLKISDRRVARSSLISNGSNDLDLAWQVGAGVFYTLNNAVSIDLKYRYFSGSEAEVKSVLRAPSGIGFNRKEIYDVGDHQIIAGVRIGF